MSQSTAGSNNPNWKGGYSRRYGSGWTIAREHVRERDEVCQYCGHEGQEYGLDVHHIVPVRRFREISDLEIDDAHCRDNLVLLCKRCHAKADQGTIDVTRSDDLSSPL